MKIFQLLREIKTLYTKDGKLKDSGGGPKFTKPNFSEILNLETLEIIQPSDTETIGYLARKGHVPVAYYKDKEKSEKTFIKVNGERYSIPGDMAKYEEDGQTGGWVGARESDDAAKLKWRD